MTGTALKDPSFRRSLALFRAFRHEQDDPEHCYSLLARDSVNQVEAYDGPVTGRTVVDVGGGSGCFTEEFRRRGAHAYLFEPDVQELGAKPPD
ncbi:MAG: SAM-dependent methyltransferase, partial [Streptomyces sp.]|nr:SAM-dependent methyltransferase [Streptomyces sp.]NUR40405.1 SAM-dependent methyltransferase [Streptomyces sp.]